MKYLALTLLIVLPTIGFTKPVDWREHNPICAKQIEVKIKELNIKSQWVRFIMGGPGEFAYRAPISVGLWAQISVDKDGVTFTKKTERNAVSQRFSDESCVPQIAIQAAPKDSLPSENDFGDSELKKVVESGKTGVIYIWSPNMTLSPQGHHHVEAITKKFGIEFHAYVDPAVNSKLVAKEAKRSRLPASSLKPMMSFDLMMRGASLHYPATFIYKDGKISRWAKHGYEDLKKFEDFIKKEIKK
tara:strand:+ start:83 stop:814 length:732 start_codon:yes stop_codon:yes gene_type:complete